jgi:hypothetical protein
MEEVRKAQIYHPLYEIWRAMRMRCLSKKHRAYQRYGGRGIKICPRWIESFSNFLEDVGDRPTPKHTLDRINNDGNYEKSNCRWATRYEQSINRSTPNRKTNKEFPRGVSIRPSGLYEVQITVDRHNYYAGSSYDVGEARRIYEEIYLEWYGKMPSYQEERV